MRTLLRLAVLLLVPACAPNADSGQTEEDYTSFRTVADLVEAPGGPQSTPSDQVQAHCVYDNAKARTLVVITDSRRVEEIGSTWSWDGSQWTRLPGTGPSARSRASLAYDQGRRVTVLYGGRNDVGELQDVWELEDDTWNEVSTTGQAPRAPELPLVYDASVGKLLSVDRQNVVTSWNGVAWKKERSLELAGMWRLLDATNAAGAATLLVQRSSEEPELARLQDGAWVFAPLRMYAPPHANVYYDEQLRRFGVLRDHYLYLEGAPAVMLPYATCNVYDAARARLVSWSPGALREVRQLVRANQPPRLVKMGGALRVYPGDSLEYAFKMYDDEDALETLVFETPALPEGVTRKPPSVNQLHPVLSWSPTHDQVGTHKFSVAAVDPHGNRDELEFEVEVVWPTLPLPEGEIHYDGAATQRGTLRNGSAVRTASIGVSCNMKGQNPGKTLIACSLEGAGDQRLLQGALDETGAAQLHGRETVMANVSRDGDDVILHLGYREFAPWGSEWFEVLQLSAMDVRLRRVR